MVCSLVGLPAGRHCSQLRRRPAGEGGEGQAAESPTEGGSGGTSATAGKAKRSKSGKGGKGKGGRLPQKEAGARQQSPRSVLLLQAKPAKARVAAQRSNSLRRLRACRPHRPPHKQAALRRQPAVPRPSRRWLQRGWSRAAPYPTAPPAAEVHRKRRAQASKLAQPQHRQACSGRSAIMQPLMLHPRALSQAQPSNRHSLSCPVRRQLQLPGLPPSQPRPQPP
jgi:hypothetical protein